MPVPNSPSMIVALRVGAIAGCMVINGTITRGSKVRFLGTFKDAIARCYFWVCSQMSASISSWSGACVWTAGRSVLRSRSEDEPSCPP